MTALLSPAMAAILDRMLAEDGPQPDPTLLPPAAGRALLEQAGRRRNEGGPAMARVIEAVVPADTALGTPPVPLRVLVPPGARDGAILFVHGGGFAFGSPDTHDRFARSLAAGSGFPVLVPAYRLAPEHPFPAGLQDVVATLRALFTATGLPRGPVIVAGDSAGANLAVAAMLHEAAAERGLPAAALLFYGVYDADFTTPSYRDFAAGPGLTMPKMQRFWNWYCPASARQDPLVTPVHAADDALLALPPLVLLAAGVDPLLSDTLAFAERLRALGRSETALVVPGVVHGFMHMTADLPEARQAMEDAVAALRRMT